MILLRRRRSDDQSLDGLRAQLRALPAPALPTGLRDRILSSRARAVRVHVPTDSWHTKSRRLPLSLAAAAILVLAVAVAHLLDRDAAPDEPLVGDAYAELLRGTLLWPERGAAQERRGAPPRPSYALVGASTLDTTRLAPGAWIYEARTTTDGVLTQSGGRIVLTLAPATHEGRPVWMASSVREGRLGWGGFPDTAYIDRARLRPLRHVAYDHKGHRIVEQVFTADSGREAIDLRTPRPRTFRKQVALPFPPDALFTTSWFAYDLGILTQALPLVRGWRGSLYQVWWFSLPQGEAFVPVDLRVRGRERLTVPAGTFDCWKLDVRLSNPFGELDRLGMWVSRDRGWLIQTEHRGSDFVVANVLVSYAPQGRP